MTEKSTLPKLADLHNVQNIEQAFKEDVFNALMNAEPKKDWIKQNKYAGNSNYIPVGIIETLLQKVFKTFTVEVLREGVMFNSVYVTVRIHLKHPVSNEPFFIDGVGAAELQTKSGASPAEMDKINKGAVQMALPMAKSYALKDAAEHLGRLFGRDLNRKETLIYTTDENLSNAFTKSNKDKIGVQND
jgi:hypothetical protein